MVNAAVLVGSRALVAYLSQKNTENDEDNILRCSRLQERLL